MRVPLSWLRDYVDITLPIEEVAERLTLAGFEVEAIEYIGIPAGKGKGGHLVWDREKIVVAEILEVKPHPNADRLVLADVNYGAAEPHTVVTGAPNLFPYKGLGPLERPLKVVYAREGATLYDGHQPGRVLMKLKPTKIRGVPSDAMVCSEKEIGLSDEHEGIMFLPDDAVPGTPLQDYLGDAVLEIALTPNLARAFSIVGIAREVAALTGQPLREPSLDMVQEGAPIDGQADIVIENAALNPRFTAALLKDLRIRPSPYWLQRRLLLAGMRPISNIVDATNYVMLELGQPLHAFDYDILVERAGGGMPTIITRTARPGETLTTLDGVARELPEFAELVTDTAGALSVAGVMGGADSEVRDTTASVLLEAASWDLINTRRTCAALHMMSEAAFRFSRGVHPAMAERGLRRCIELMRQLGGGEIARGILDRYPAPPAEVTLALAPQEVERVLGLHLSGRACAGLLERVDFRCSPPAQALAADDYTTPVMVTAPDTRMDIAGVEDLLEEIARLYGYDRIPLTLIADVLPPQRMNRDLELEEEARDLLVAAGLREIIAYALTTPAREARLLPGLPPDDRPYVTVANPISAERTVMRHTLLDAVLETLAQNAQPARQHDRVALFEISHVYLGAEDALLPEEPRRLALALWGRRTPPHWQGPQGDTALDFFDLKGIVEALLAGLHVPGVSFDALEAPHPTYHPRRVAQLVVEGHRAGLLGELHPRVRAAYDVPGDAPVLVADLDLDLILAHVPAERKVHPVPRFPAVQQDVAIVVDADIPAARVQAVIEKAGGALLQRARLFDVYTGAPIPAGKRSLAYSLTYLAPDRTLKDEDAAKVHAKIVRRLEEELGATLR